MILAAFSDVLLMIEKGIPKEALQSKGFGSEKPIASNDTEEGKEKNRRVEFNVIEQDITKKKVEIDPATGKEKVLDTTTETSGKAEEADKPTEKTSGLARPKAEEKQQ